MDRCPAQQSFSIPPHTHTHTQILRLDITPMSTPHSSTLPHTHPTLDMAKIVTFSPAAINQLLVITSNARLLKFNCSNGQLLSEVAHTHRTQCSAVCVSKSGRHLLTAGDGVVKVWDYGMNLDLNFQVSDACMLLCNANVLFHSVY